MWRPWFPWVPVLFVSLVLLTLIGGLTVWDFYWNDLRPDMGRIGANLAQVRDRQRVMMGNFAEAQALLLEQQRHLAAQAQDLRRREQAVYEARLEIEAQRAQLAQARQVQPERQGLAAARLAEAADLAETAADGLSQDDDLDATRAALALAAAVLARLPGPAGDPGRAALAVAQSRLAEVGQVDRATLAQRLRAVRESAIGLRPVAARLLRPSAGDRTGAQGRHADPVNLAAQSLDSQFEAARVALDAADSAGFVVAMQGIDRWLSAFFEPRLPDTAAVLTELRALTKTSIAADVAPLSKALVELAAVLRKSAAQPGDK
jgi:uncharacterized protein HemX